MASKQYSGVRESHPGRVNDLGTTGREVKENYEKGCLKRADRTFAQGLQCQQINSMAALMSLEDSVFISHSPQGCVGCAIMAVDMYRVGQAHREIKNIKNPRIIVTNIDQKSVVFGGENKLREAVKKAVDRYNPKIAFIYASCASGIIGDDIDAIAADLGYEYPDTLMVPIHCEGFKSKICASGFDAAFIAINKYILKKEKVPKEDDLVNLFAPTTVSYADQKEMERMLSLIGARVNYIPFYSSLDKIKKIPAAKASTSICKVFADEFMKTLWEDYGIPYSHTVMPIGIRNTDIWYRGIAKVLGKEAEVEEIIKKEHERIEPLVQKLRERLSGKRVFICGGTGRSFAAAALNIIINPWLFKGPAKRFEDKFGVKSIRVPGLFVGATDTTAFVRQVSDALNLNRELTESVIKKEEDYVYSYLAQAIGVVSWKRYAVVADASNAVGITRYLANDFSFTPVLVIISEPIFRPEDKERIINEISRLEYARPPKVIFATDQYEINEAIRNEEEEITLLIGSSNEREVALEKDIQFILGAFPVNERLIFNRTYAGYRGSLTFTEDLYDNL